ncbi:SDR family NAD(P)-dependent oxidoreductase [Silanimonas sp.]|jgi:NAD(P)-dependent dehydrogenase (short-subunit alcohol dehydrogenase family)|uniref:SDR family NAD(P)-dependent oxidoreductase n=1 Tax=Silanimonas sp. TaxID=1929290 RepID=UPI0037C68F4E
MAAGSTNPASSARLRVLITGAGSGLGLALAQRYARDGACLLCVDLDPARAQAAASSLPGDGHLAFQADVGDDASIDALKAAVEQAVGGVDVLVNNAGIASGGALLGTDMAEWRRLIEVDLLSVVRCTLAFLPGMVERGRGHVVSTASFAGLAGAPGIMSYGVAKAGVVAFSEQLRAEMHGTGVDVSVLCPAFFRTNLLENFHGDAKVRGMASRMMDKSPDTLDSVADATYAALQARTFLVLPTKHEPMRWRLKRWFPNWYFKKLMETAGAMRRG